LNNEVKIRAFRAVDEPDACRRFSEGHANVLNAYGVTKVTSANNEWANNPDVYVCMAESSEGIAYGGVRVHVSNGSILLPMEVAIGKVEDNVYEFINKYAEKGAAELCGLWNAREAAGFGIGTTYLMWAGIAIITQLQLNTLFALCAEHTLKISVEKGFVIEMGLGNRGTFFYPKIDLIATSIVVRDPAKLATADTYHREQILNLRENPTQTRVEETSRGPLKIEFDLKLKNINPLPFHVQEDTNRPLGR
jgi:hypothetical protein